MNTSLPYVMRDQVVDQIGQIMEKDEQAGETGLRQRLIETGLFVLFVSGYLLALAFNA